jgi:hypothetical protein
VDRLLDLAREDIETLYEHHVLLAVGDKEEAVRVEMADVAGVDVPVADGLRGLLGTVAVAAHHVRTARPHLPPLTRRQHPPAGLEVHDLHRVARERLADRAWPESGEFIGATDRRHLRHAVALVDIEPGCPAPTVHELDGERRAPGRADPELREIGADQVGGR